MAGDTARGCGRGRSASVPHEERQSCRRRTGRRIRCERALSVVSRWFKMFFFLFLKRVVFLSRRSDVRVCRSTVALLDRQNCLLIPPQGSLSLTLFGDELHVWS